MIEVDWWPKKVKLLFVNKQNTTFNRGEAYAQAMCVPREEYTVKEMEDDEVKKMEKASEHLEEHKDEYITRKESFKKYADKDNLYESMSKRVLRDELPKELQEDKPKLGSRLRTYNPWKPK